MTNTSAPIINYKDYDKHKVLECPECQWKGLPEGNIELFERLFDVTCPKCDKMLLIVNYPLVDD